MRADEGCVNMRKRKICFCCLNEGHRVYQCSLKSTYSKDGCLKKQNRLLHGDENTQSKAKLAEASANIFSTANMCCGSLQVLAVRFSNGANNIDTLAVCDTGSTLSFIDEKIKKQPATEETKLTLSVAGINGTKAMASERISVKMMWNDYDEAVTFPVHPRIYLGNTRYDFSRVKHKYHHLKVLPKIKLI